jgi:DNA-binding CsgD family transcriptional regulator
MFKRGRGYKVSPEEVEKIIHLFTVEKKTIKEIKEITKRSDSSISNIVFPYRKKTPIPHGLDKSIINCLSTGMRQPEISAHLKLEPSLTYEAMRWTKRKYRARNYAHLVAIAYQDGILKTG